MRSLVIAFAIVRATPTFAQSAPKCTPLAASMHPSACGAGGGAPINVVEFKPTGSCNDYKVNETSAQALIDRCKDPNVARQAADACRVASEQATKAAEGYRKCMAGQATGSVSDGASSPSKDLGKLQDVAKDVTRRNINSIKQAGDRAKDIHVEKRGEVGRNSELNKLGHSDVDLDDLADDSMPSGGAADVGANSGPPVAETRPAFSVDDSSCPVGTSYVSFSCRLSLPTQHKGCRHMGTPCGSSLFGPTCLGTIDCCLAPAEKASILKASVSEPIHLCTYESTTPSVGSRKSPSPAEATAAALRKALAEGALNAAADTEARRQLEKLLALKLTELGSDTDPSCWTRRAHTEGCRPIPGSADPVSFTKPDLAKMQVLPVAPAAPLSMTPVDRRAFERFLDSVGSSASPQERAAAKMVRDALARFPETQ